jgi:hypothetical protein
MIIKSSTPASQGTPEEGSDRDDDPKRFGLRQRRAGLGWRRAGSAARRFVLTWPGRAADWPLVKQGLGPVRALFSDAGEVPV